MSAVGLVTKAAEAAATYLVMEPSDDVMSDNLRYYTTVNKVTADSFAPREVGRY